MEAIPNRIGYFIAALGSAVLVATMWLMGTGRLDDKTIIILLVLVAAALIALGMYAVVPKATHDALSDFGDLGERLRPFSLKNQVKESGVQPTVVQPAAGQSTVVQPPDSPPVAVGPHGEVEVGSSPGSDPETQVGEALPLIAQPTALRKPGAPSVGDAQRRRQQKYPPSES